MTEYKNPLIDPIERTRKNLALVRNQFEYETQQNIPQDARTAFEVTEMVNAFLSILAHPWEKLFDRTALQQIKVGSEAYFSLGFPEISETYEGNSEHANNLNQLLRLMRNGIAHGNIEMLNPQQIHTEANHRSMWNLSSDDIAGAVIWNIKDELYRPDPKACVSHKFTFRSWAIALTLDQMNEMLTALAAMSSNPKYKSRNSRASVLAKRSITKSDAKRQLLERLAQEAGSSIRRTEQILS